MNPISAEDFIPREPDWNNNGLPDIWEQVGYADSFHDANGNGFDDAYEMYYLPAASDSNFDVLIDIYSTRSVMLSWENEVILAKSSAWARRTKLTQAGSAGCVPLQPFRFSGDWINVTTNSPATVNFISNVVQSLCVPRT